MADTAIPNRGRVIRKTVATKKPDPVNKPKSSEPVKPSQAPPETAQTESAAPVSPDQPVTVEELAPKMPSAEEDFLKPIAAKLKVLFPKTQVTALLSSLGPESHHALVRLVRYLWPMRDGVMAPEKVLQTAPDRLKGFLFALNELKEKDSQQYELLLAFLKKQRKIPQHFSQPYLFRGFGLKASQAQKEMAIKAQLEAMGLC